MLISSCLLYTSSLKKLEQVVVGDIIGLVFVIGMELIKAVRYAAMNRILQKKVYLDEATGMPNKNKCEEILEESDGGEEISGVYAVCVFDLNNLRTINNSLCLLYTSAEVPRDVDIEVSHDIIDRIEHEVGEKLGILLVIHMDPVEIHDATVLATKEKVRNVISILDPELSFHDFRMINGSEKKKLIFDLEIPYSYKKKDCDRVIGQIGALMKEMDEKYECVVNIDKKYVAGE